MKANIVNNREDMRGSLLRWICLFVMNTLLFIGVSSAQASVCFGTSAKGRLDGGQRIPESGANFTPYSSIGVLAGRTYVHAKLATIILNAYKHLEISAPDKKYVYGESGWEHGGRLRPHRTHQNGLAVDFMVAVTSTSGRSIPLPTGITNKFGYGIEFDSKAQYKELSIDFEAISEHLFSLNTAALAQGVKIYRVIFEKSYIPRLYKTKKGEWIKQHIPFMQGEPWIRHDEHYHVDFDIPCQPMPEG